MEGREEGRKEGLCCREGGRAGQGRAWNVGRCGTGWVGLGDKVRVRALRMTFDECFIGILEYMGGCMR